MATAAFNKSVVRVGINGFGRMGRLVFRALWKRWPGIDIVHVNDPKANAVTCAYLLQFDSVHGQWKDAKNREHEVAATQSKSSSSITIDGHSVSLSQLTKPEEVGWRLRGVDIVVESSGKFVTLESLKGAYDDKSNSVSDSKSTSQGPLKVVVTAPVKGALNVVMGVNHHLYQPSKDHIVTAASCTTNCLAPIVKVLLENTGILRGAITTVHNVTNTQTVVDLAVSASDLRRNRSALMSLIPTTTGSATAISLIFPQLKGKLDGLAIRVPLLNTSITDCVFEVSRPTTKAEVNKWMQIASQSKELSGILGYEERPLVSVDFKDDTRSSVIDALSTMVVDGTLVKILSWYDNEIGYAHRTAELVHYMFAHAQTIRSSL